MAEDTCKICLNIIAEEEKSNKLTEKGIASLQSGNRERNDSPMNFTTYDRVHFKCRLDYTNKKVIQNYLRGKNVEESRYSL